MATINTPKTISVSNDDILLAIKRLLVEREPELVDEEFEVSITYNTYSHETLATVQII